MLCACRESTKCAPVGQGSVWADSTIVSCLLCLTYSTSVRVTCHVYSNADHLWLHIRSMGDWTNNLYDLCLKYNPLDYVRDRSNELRAQPGLPIDDTKIDLHIKGE